MGKTVSWRFLLRKPAKGRRVPRATAWRPALSQKFREECLNGQLAELQAAGCAKVYSEKASGARGDG
jgi:hypothetical protein